MCSCSSGSAIFIHFYLDGGWWATPWIEFGAALSFLALAFWQWGRGIRPRWLPVIPWCWRFSLAPWAWCCGRSAPSAISAGWFARPL